MQTMMGSTRTPGQDRAEHELLEARVYDYTEPCPYLPGREARLEGFFASTAPDSLYRSLLDHSFRRSGGFFYRPACVGCSECRPIRVPVDGFAPSRSQRRCWKRNAGLQVEIGVPVLTEEKWELYARYQREKHGRKEEKEMGALQDFLYTPVVSTIEFCYRTPAGTLAAVGLCDVLTDALSSVYCYYDASDRQRGLGTYTALYELDYARQKRLAYYYLGYFVRGCQSMRYKAFFAPCELLEDDGIWRERMGGERLALR